MSKTETGNNSTENMTRLTPIMIYKLLKEESSQDHHLSTGYILSRLEEGGVKITRQTMYKDIDLLNQLGFNIEGERHRSNEYYLVQEEFNVAEQRILLDAVQSARFIPKNELDSLAYKVASLNGAAEAQNLLNTTMRSPNAKYADKRIYYYINNIAEAISQGRKISFYYFDYNEKRQKQYRHDKKLYEENPVCTVCSNNNYYLVVYSEADDKLMNYRIDRMDNVNVMGKDSKLPADIKQRTQEHLDSQFSMFSGETVNVSFETDENLINAIFDMFGDDIRFLAAPDNKVHFRARVQISPTFYSWVAGFKGRIRIVRPSRIVLDFCDFLKWNLVQYPYSFSGIFVDRPNEEKIMAKHEMMRENRRRHEAAMRGAAGQPPADSPSAATSIPAPQDKAPESPAATPAGSHKESPDATNKTRE